MEPNGNMQYVQAVLPFFFFFFKALRRSSHSDLLCFYYFLPNCEILSYFLKSASFVAMFAKNMYVVIYL